MSEPVWEDPGNIFPEMSVLRWNTPVAHSAVCVMSFCVFVCDRYRVVVPYPPQSEAEIELREGDVVFVHKKREDGWYKGTLQRTGETGLFPSSFVESF